MYTITLFVFESEYIFYTTPVDKNVSLFTLCNMIHKSYDHGYFTIMNDRGSYCNAQGQALLTNEPVHLSVQYPHCGVLGELNE